MSPLSAAPGPPRSPWQLVYGALLARRARRLRRSAARLPRPVVSIGNLHWGGGGKTPLTLAVAAHLRDAGRAVAILSRGYLRTSRGALVVSAGGGPLVSVDEAGDEPYLMASMLADVAVVVARRRVDAGRLALTALPRTPEILLLDDGFSHLALARDLDLLVFPKAEPWGRGRLAPRGHLREPLTAAARADAAVLTGGEPGEGAELARELGRFGFAGPGFASSTVALAPAWLDGSPVAPGTRVYALAAIARPESFFAAAEGSRLVIAGRRGFRDHRRYSDLDLRDLERAARAAGAEAILTTAKDCPKLAGRTALPLAVLPIEARPEPAFWTWLAARLARLEP